MRRIGRILVAGVMVAAVGPSVAAPSAGWAQAPPSPASTVSVFATGLDNPRGLSFGPDGSLYVAEGGRGGTTSTAGQCQQVPPPYGPYTGSPTSGRISKIMPNGTRTTVTDTLPSSQGNPASGQEVSGVADVNFLGTTLYALLGGAGCSHGVPSLPNGVVQVNADGTWKLVANLSAFQASDPVQNVVSSVFEPDGRWYNMVHLGTTLYGLDPNHGELDAISPSTGQINRVADISASQGHVVPTGLAIHNGAFYVGTVGVFPVRPGIQRILRITPGGDITTVVTGLTAVVGVTFDPEGRMYALELSTVAGNLTPGTGTVVRVTQSGGVETIATGLAFPTAMTFGPDGQLYVSTYGFGYPPGSGQVVRIPIAGAAAASTSRSGPGTVTSFTVSFASSAAGQGEVLFGTGPGCSGLVEVATSDRSAGTKTHTVVVTGNDLPGTVGNNGLQPGVTYYYEVVTVTRSGMEIDNNGGSCYSVTVPNS